MPDESLKIKTVRYDGNTVTVTYTETDGAEITEKNPNVPQPSFIDALSRTPPSRTLVRTLGP